MRTFLYVLIYLSALSFGNLLQAQGKGSHLGVRFGGNFSTWVGEYRKRTVAVKQGYHFGFQIGCALHIPVLEQIAIEAGLQFILQGTQEGESLSINNRQLQRGRLYRLGYLDFPLLFKYYPLRAAKGLNLQLGPRVNHIVSKSGAETIKETSREGTRIIESRSYDRHSFEVRNSQGEKHSLFNTTNVGLILGIGYDALQVLMVDLRYSLDFSRVLNEEAGDEYTHQSTHRSHVVSLSVACFLPLGGRKKSEDYPDWYGRKQ